MKETITQRLLFAALLLMAVLNLCAQEAQQGHVKTLGRPNKSGENLSGVSIKVSEASNDVVSNQSGFFSFYPSDKNFTILRVRKNNFQLVDPTIIGRLYPYSATIPVEIVMVSSIELLKEKQRIEDKAYAKAELMYKKKIAFLEQQLEQSIINSNDAEKQRIQIHENYQRYINLIGRMAEQYALIDYDGISGTNKLIMQYIEDGELERADSLLKAKGDFDIREANLQQQENELLQAEAIIRQTRLALDEKRRDLAQDYYYKHSILAGSYQHDSAAYYLERRSALDTTNVDWIIDAGKFITDYLADYPRALRLYRRALNTATRKYGEQHMQVAICNILIGEAMMAQGRYAMAMDYFVTSKNIIQQLPQQGVAELARCYYNMAVIYMHVEEGPYRNAAASMNAATDLVKELYGENDRTYADLLTLGAQIAIENGNGKTATNKLNQARIIYENIPVSNEIEIAKTFCELGIAMSNSGQYEDGQTYILKACGIWKKQFGEHHPYVAYSYGAMADSYTKQHKYDDALLYYQKALENQTAVFGEAHPFIAEWQLKLGQLQRKQGDFYGAAQYAMQALNTLLLLPEYQERHVISIMQRVDSWLSAMRTAHQQSEEEQQEMFTEFNRLQKLYRNSANKKIRLKNIML